MAHTVQCKTGNVPYTNRKSRFKGFKKNQPSYGPNLIDLRHYGDLPKDAQKAVFDKSGYQFNRIAYM